jgi:hypothetical protein
MSIFAHIAYEDGVLFSVWGPCSCSSTDDYCIQCQHIDKLEAEGKDYEEEYQKAIQK